MPTVQTNDGRTLIFPEGMSQNDMAEAMNKLPPATPQDSPSYRGTAEGSIAAGARTSMERRAQGGDQPPAPPEKSFVEKVGEIDPINIHIGMGKGVIGTGYHVGKMMGVIPESKA